MAEKKYLRVGRVDSEPPIHGPKIVEAFAPTIGLREKPEMACSRAWSMAAMVARGDKIAGLGQCAGKTLVPTCMLAETMGDLHRGARRALLRPAIDLNFRAVFAVEKKARRLHRRLSG